MVVRDNTRCGLSNGLQKTASKTAYYFIFGIVIVKETG